MNNSGLRNPVTERCPNYLLISKGLDKNNHGRSIFNCAANIGILLKKLIQ